MNNMQIKYFMPIFALVFLLSSGIVSATPPSRGEFLFVKETIASSDKLTFLDSNLEPQNYSRRNKIGFPSFRYFEVSGSPERLIISFDENEIINSEIDTLKTELRRFNHNTQEWRNIPTYEFPNQDIFGWIYTKSDESFDLKSYNGSIVTFYLDDELVREFVLGYEPAYIYGGGNLYRRSNYIMYALIGGIALIIGAVIFIIIKKRRRQQKIF